jgi:ABC-type cobalamin transport system permease subunit
MMALAWVVGLACAMAGSAGWVGVALHIAHEIHQRRFGHRRELAFAYAVVVGALVGLLATLAAAVRLVQAW